MLTGPIPATRRILERSGLSMDDLDAYEVNEAFASVPLAWTQELGRGPQRSSIRGEARSLSATRWVLRARACSARCLSYLEATGGRYGLQTMCEGGGLANATIIERL